MVTEADIDDVWREARLRVVSAIAAKAKKPDMSPQDAQVIKDLSEAAAWLSNPAQPHGGH